MSNPYPEILIPKEWDSSTGKPIRWERIPGAWDKDVPFWIEWEKGGGLSPEFSISTDDPEEVKNEKLWMHTCFRRWKEYTEMVAKIAAIGMPEGPDDPSPLGGSGGPAPIPDYSGGGGGGGGAKPPAAYVNPDPFPTIDREMPEDWTPQDEAAWLKIGKELWNKVGKAEQAVAEAQRELQVLSGSTVGAEKSTAIFAEVVGTLKTMKV